MPRANEAILELLVAQAMDAREAVGRGLRAHGAFIATVRRLGWRTIGPGGLLDRDGRAWDLSNCSLVDLKACVTRSVETQAWQDWHMSAPGAPLAPRPMLEPIKTVLQGNSFIAAEKGRLRCAVIGATWSQAEKGGQGARGRRHLSGLRA